jgi:hypothetical protein
MVLLSDRSFSVPQTAEIHACAEDVVRHWLHPYQELEIAGPGDESHPGRPAKDPMAKYIVDAQAGQSPDCSGHLRPCPALLHVQP